MAHAETGASPQVPEAPDAAGSTTVVETDRAVADGLLRARLREQRGLFALGIVAALVQQLAMLAMPWATQYAIDDGITSGDLGTALMWSGAVAVFALVMFGAGVGGQWWMGLAAFRTAQAVRRTLIDRIAVLDRAGMAEAGFGHGDLAIRLTRDVDMVRDWVQGLAAWVRIGVTVAVVLPALAVLDVRLLGVTLVTVPLLVAANILFPRRFARANETLSQAHSDRADAVEDLLSASAAVRGLGGERALVRRHHRVSGLVTEHTMGVARISSWWSAIPPSLPRFAIAAGLLVGGFSVIDGSLTVGGLVAFTSWMTTMAIAAGVAVDMMSNRGQARVSAGRIAAVADAEPRVTEPVDPVALPELGALEVHGVVAHRGDRRVLGPVDLTAPAGAFVAVTGATGSGKSVLARLLGRLDDPDAGSVTFGGVDLRTAALTDVRARIATVPQRPVVLSGTVTENLLLGRDVPADVVAAACAAAAADRFVEALPEGFGTVLGERGTTLSGGQVQRLALARALIGRPRVLVLDDVTSAVDPATEKRILAGLREFLPDTTVLFVTHRPAAVAAADVVVNLEKAAVRG
ncbi:ABC transporter ATP-binding protein [Pseudonocardia sp. N23]|uniref:ABC transporter ATP-binding protein n=1 Tax=Pseudonocardia sp. N23 TaxID=1987376 RepID=UPI000C037B26|nr:ABC transporter ATP-binding protein [Pseudonocardia sp. N23]GAY08794.1 ABC transporter related protein [Pseudonocardia sp. N23]